MVKICRKKGSMIIEVEFRWQARPWTIMAHPIRLTITFRVTRRKRFLNTSYYTLRGTLLRIFDKGRILQEGKGGDEKMGCVYLWKSEAKGASRNNTEGRAPQWAELHMSSSQKHMWPVPELSSMHTWSTMNRFICSCDVHVRRTLSYSAIKENNCPDLYTISKNARYNSS